MLASCDSLAQRARWGRSEEEHQSAVATVVGDLRLARLLGYDVVLTYAQLLDGIVLLELGPAGVARALGVDQRRLPLVVSAPSQDLSAVIPHMESEDFESSSEAALIADGATTSAALARVQLLRAAWIAASAQDRSLVIGVPPRASVAGFLGEPPRVAPEALPVVARLRDSPTRSAYRTARNDAVANEQISEHDAELLDRWWADAYDAMLAEQHGASLLSVETSSHRRAAGSQRLCVVESTARNLRNMPPALFESVVFQVAQVAERREEGALLTQKGVTAISYVVRRACDPADRRSDSRGAWVRIAILAPLAFVAFASDLLGEGAFRVALLAGIAQGLPWTDIFALVALRRDDTGPVVYLKEHGA